MVYVCPEKDSVCGDLSSNWCGGCPMWQKRQRLGSATLRPMPGLPQPTPPQAPEADTEHEQRWPNAVTPPPAEATEEVVQRIMGLALAWSRASGRSDLDKTFLEFQSALRAALTPQPLPEQVMEDVKRVRLWLDAGRDTPTGSIRRLLDYVESKQ